MTIMDALPIRTRGLMALWLLLLLYVGFFILFRYVQRRRWWVRYIPLLVLMILEYTLFQAVMLVTFVIPGLEKPGWMYSVFHTQPFLRVILAELVMTVYTVYLWWKTWEWQRLHITGSSVKEGVDSLPTGLLYFWDDGRIKLVNRRMMEITRQLTGLSLQDGRRLMTRLWEGQSPDKDSILRLPDQTDWSFHHRELMMEGEKLHELIAADVTEEYRLREELAEENRRLAAMNRRLQDLNDMIGEITVEKETLAAMPMDTIKSNGYVFQVEMNYVASKMGFKIVEIPIYFQERTMGKSKMNLKISLEAAWRTLALRSQHKDLVKR